MKIAKLEISNNKRKQVKQAVVLLWIFQVSPVGPTLIGKVCCDQALLAIDKWGFIYGHFYVGKIERATITHAGAYM